MKSLFRFRLLFASAILAPAAHSAVLVDFNTPGQFEQEFSSSQFFNKLAQSETGGLNNSGGIGLDSISSTQIWTLNTSFRGDLESWTAEFYVKAAYFTAFGFTSAPMPGESEGYPLNSTFDAYGSSISMGTGNLNGDSIGIANDGVLVSDELVTVPLVNEWYRYRISVQYLGNNDFQVAAAVNVADSTGAVFAEIASAQALVNNPALAAADDVYLFLGFTQFGESVDNVSFSVVPEPSAFGLALLSSAFLITRRKR